VPHRRDSSVGLGLNVQQRAGGQNLEELSIEEVEGILVRKGPATLSWQRKPGGGSAWASVAARCIAGWNAMDSSSGGDYSNPINPSGCELGARWGPQARGANCHPSNATLQAALRKTHPAVRYPGCAARSRLRHHSRLDSDWTRDIKISLTVLEFFLWLVLTLALLDQNCPPAADARQCGRRFARRRLFLRARGAAPNDALASSRSKSILSRHPDRAAYSDDRGHCVVAPRGGRN